MGDDKTQNQQTQKESIKDDLLNAFGIKSTKNSAKSETKDCIEKQTKEDIRSLRCQ